ncbi:MAG: hypothetical protein F4X82_03410 [Candidatus Spechtbacteria bacterium SB0662_bin_43]|uniref:Uncharacterized protein n=1 Tax=Candidatus Spechtbacteria bacterium SB0662_bin_43 TaxID=2604897 RepID=A0A845DAV0_9BACT|nr:hypothetical protein [Candidatus Spechtbacteria bacterium SB0662_bin_43]
MATQVRPQTEEDVLMNFFVPEDWGYPVLAVRLVTMQCPRCKNSMFLWFGGRKVLCMACGAYGSAPETITVALPPVVKVSDIPPYSPVPEPAVPFGWAN